MEKNNTSFNDRYDAADPYFDLMHGVIKDLIFNGTINERNIAKESGVNASALNQFLNRTKSKTRFDTVHDRLQTWYDTFQRRLEAEKELPDGPGFIHTNAAERIENAITYAHMANDISLIYGGAGVGKTETFREYVRNNSGVCLATMTAVHSTLKASMAEIGKCLGVKHAKDNASLFDQICEQLKAKRGLLIIDEAQHLHIRSLDQLRQIHDATGCGLVLAGNEQVYSNITGGNRAEYLDRLYSRVGMRTRIQGVIPGDAEKIASAWGITDEAIISIIIDISRRPGALRTVHKTIKYACLLSGNRKPQTKHIRAAYKRLTEES